MKINQLKDICSELRLFNTGDVYQTKINKINKYFLENKLDSVVVGLSGGIDSSLVLMLYLHASQVYNSPIKKVVGLFLPIYSNGVTGQDTASIFVNELLFTANTYESFEYRKIDLTSISNDYSRKLKIYDPWTIGQIDSIIRTPVTYGVAADLQFNGFKSIVSGTINKDEGAYIGFFGKASDGMNDIQPIADLHKSEVIKLAQLMSINSAIINRPPEGDVWNGALDEDTIGCPYWVLEIYQILKHNNCTYLINKIVDCEDLIKWCINVEVIHTKNKHKYKFENNLIIPYTYAVYVDAMERLIKYKH